MKIIQTLLKICYTVICWSLVYMWYFNWFISPAFDLKEINYAQGICLYMFSRVVKMPPANALYYKNELIESREDIWRDLWLPWVAGLFGLIISSYF